jgi:hypothetical protein
VEFSGAFDWDVFGQLAISLAVYVGIEIEHSIDE